MSDVESITGPRTDFTPPSTEVVPAGPDCIPSPGSPGFTATDTRDTARPAHRRDPAGNPHRHVRAAAQDRSAAADPGRVRRVRERGGALPTAAR